MSRLTATQIIAQGDYLGPDFDPLTLTVSQLLGVLSYHDIPYPTPFSKPKLVALFNKEIKPKSGKLKRERLKKENSIASDDGIKDGVTGELIGRKEPVRRSSRRSSRAPADEEEAPVVRAEPPKRRRSSAQPSLGGPSRVSKIEPKPEPLYEESEPEEDLPPPKVGRSKKTSVAAGTQSRRRVSQAEDSGWEDNNIFQSGAESSSPLRPSPVRPKPRKSAAPRKSCKSMSAPPQLSPPASPALPSRVKQENYFSPPQSKFEPELSPEVQRETRLMAPSFAKPRLSGIKHDAPRYSLEFKEEEEEEDEDELNIVGESYAHHHEHEHLPDQEEEFEKFEQEEEQEQEATDDEDMNQVIDIQRRLANDGTIVRRRPQSSSTPFFVRALSWLTTIGLLAFVVDYKLESAPIGYCDLGKNTNRALEELRSKRVAIETCNRENRTLLWSADEVGYEDVTPCPVGPIFPTPHPNTCTPCPEHGQCTQYSVACDKGYLLRPHPLLFFLPPNPSPSNLSVSLSSSPGEMAWTVVSTLTDGLPGLGSVGLPPRCVEDPKRKRNIGVLGKAISSLLGEERGRLVCAGEHHGDGPVKEEDGGEAKQWGFELGDLKENMRKKTSPSLRSNYDDMFNEAIQQLTQWDGVILGEDKAGRRYLAHKTPNLTWNCKLTVKFRETWLEWRATVFALLGIALTILTGKTRRTRRIAEGKRVSELVQIALDTLRTQEMAHHTDPITAPQPYLSSLQLRDLILQDEHSVSTRQRVWDQVERVVEGNANVRANLEEVHGGDELRVWRWVGGGSGIRKQILSQTEASQAEAE